MQYDYFANDQFFAVILVYRFLMGRCLAISCEDIHESRIAGRIYLNMETLKEWEEKKNDQTKDEKVVQ